MARLREIFKDNLFIRGSHGVLPTQFAQDLYPTLASAVESIAYTLPEHSKFRPEECTKQFSVAALSVFGYTLMPFLVHHFSVIAPKARVKIEPYFGADPSNVLRSQQYDLVVEIESNSYTQLRSERIMEDTLLVACRSDHPRLTGGCITKEQFLAEKHVVHTQHMGNTGYLVRRGVSDEHLLQQRNIAWQSGNIMESIPVVAMTDYITLIPRRLVASALKHRRIKILDCEFLQQPIGVAMYWHPSRTNDPSHRWLRSSMKKVAEHVENRDEDDTIAGE